MACAAGLGLGLEVQGQCSLEWKPEARYATWGAAGSLGAKVAAFVDGAANLLRSIGLAAPVALA